jgi:hypothetical protein
LDLVGVPDARSDGRDVLKDLLGAVALAELVIEATGNPARVIAPIAEKDP